MQRTRGQAELQNLRGDLPVRRFTEILGLGLHYVAVWRWLRGISTPNAHHRLILERRHGIGYASWDEPAKET